MTAAADGADDPESGEVSPTPNADDENAAVSEKPTGSGTSPASTTRNGGGPSWLYLAGLVGFLVTAIAFVADLWTGHDIFRSVLLNAGAAVVLVTWAGLDSYRDRDSGVQTIAGAIGTGMILVGVYLLAAGVVVAATSVVHDRLVIGLGMVAGGVPLVLGGFLVFPVDALLGGDDDAGAGERTEGPGEEESES